VVRKDLAGLVFVDFHSSSFVIGHWSFVKWGLLSLRRDRGNEKINR
jgi:hypothetical protein